ncbi:MAG TPA: hypothetical protein PKY59_05500 [Pyrinomonadaceae bacterium]|nr:hypothetical protein [Pyrinomonadaceae bacterium]
MKRKLAVILFLTVFAVFNVSAQKDEPKKPVEVPKTTAVNNANEDALKLAKAALEAHGGDKYLKMKTLIVRGSSDITTSAMAQAIPATFVLVFAGDKYRMELNNPFAPFKQVYDGKQTSSTMRGGFSLPPLNRLGMPLLPKIGETGYVVTALPEEKKKKKGFRITSPEGYFTDFYLDDKTNQVKAYDSSYEINGNTVTTSVEIDKYKTVEGIVIPEKYAQRFDMGQITAYSDFKAKEILVNSEVADDVFTIQN